MKVGFIGLGRMGSGMAANLLQRHGGDLVVYDVNTAAMRPLVAIGAQAASSVADVAGVADVIMTSLPGPKEIEAVVFGPDGIAEHVRPGVTLIDLSANSHELVMRIYHAFTERGAFVLDSPVSGQPAGARSGQLAMSWGDADVYERCLPLLKSIGSHPRRIGPIGSGTVTKLANNMVAHMIKLSLAEVFTLAVKSGIDPLDFWEALSVGVVGKQSPLFMLTNSYPGKYDSPANTLDIAHKDMSLGTALGRSVGVPMRVAALTNEEITEAVNRGYGSLDARIFMTLQVERAGVEIAVEAERLASAVAAARSASRSE